MQFSTNLLPSLEMLSCATRPWSSWSIYILWLTIPLCCWSMALITNMPYSFFSIWSKCLMTASPTVYVKVWQHFSNTLWTILQPNSFRQNATIFYSMVLMMEHMLGDCIQWPIWMTICCMTWFPLKLREHSLTLSASINSCMSSSFWASVNTSKPVCRTLQPCLWVEKW